MLITVLGLALLGFCFFSEDEHTVSSYLLAMLAWLAIAGLNFVTSVFSDSATEAK